MTIANDRYASQAQSLLRIVAALLFLQHATAKLFGVPPSAIAFPPPMSLLWVAGIIELVGSVLLLIGLFSRSAAFILSGEMAVAYWMMHAPQSIYPLVNKGEGAVLFCFIFLFIAAAGPGPWSLDAGRSRKSVSIEDGTA
jgi:putative oxidoreductase